MKCIPDGCVTVIFIRKGDSCKVELLGTPLAAKQLIVYPDALYFCVRLEPGMKFPYSHITGCALSTRDIADTEVFLPHLDGDMKRLVERLFAAPSFEDRVESFCSYLLTFSVEELFVKPGLMDMLRRIYSAKGNVNIREMADVVCYSERQFSRIFQQALGYSPKTFARIVRFQHVLGQMYRLIKCGMDVADMRVSHFLSGLDYSDQSHFQREFKDFTSLTPRQFAAFAYGRGLDSKCAACAGRGQCVDGLCHAGGGT
jgi:AraC-like DNA-binding protein